MVAALVPQLSLLWLEMQEFSAQQRCWLVRRGFSTPQSLSSNNASSNALVSAVCQRLSKQCSALRFAVLADHIQRVSRSLKFLLIEHTVLSGQTCKADCAFHAFSRRRPCRHSSGDWESSCDGPLRLYLSASEKHVQAQSVRLQLAAVHEAGGAVVNTVSTPSHHTPIIMVQQELWCRPMLYPPCAQQAHEYDANCISSSSR
jgi:hypothetical protein